MMKITVETNGPVSNERETVIRFGKALAENNASELEGLLRDARLLVRRGLNTLEDHADILASLKDWMEQKAKEVQETGEPELIVKWFPYTGNYGLFIKRSEDEAVILLRLESGRISDIEFARDTYRYPPFFYNELPFNIEFIKANAHKEAEPLENHLFCPACGARSESLTWTEGIVFQKRRGRSVGALSFFSYCEKCNLVVEMTRNRKWNHVLTMTPEQEDIALSVLSAEEKAEYIDGTYGNKKPKRAFLTPSKSNDLGKTGREFFSFITQEIIGNQAAPSLIFDKLTCLKLDEGKEIGLHHAGTRENSDEGFDDELCF